MLPETTNNALPDTLGSSWKSKVFKEYLAERGLFEIPRNPIEIKDYGQWLKNKGYKPTSIAALLSPVRELYRAIGIETRKIIKGPKKHLTFLRDPVPTEDVLKLLKYVKENCSLRDRLIVELMAYLGLRDIEISRMDRGDFYKQDDDYILKLWRKGHEGKDKQKKVTNGLLATFLEYLNQTQGNPNDPMFMSQKKCRLRPDTISHIVGNIMKSAGIKNAENSHRISPHSLRHTVGTIIAKQTKDVFAVQQMLDHADVRTSMIYIHNADSPENLINWEV